MDARIVPMEADSSEEQRQAMRRRQAVSLRTFLLYRSTKLQEDRVTSSDDVKMGMGHTSSTPDSVPATCEGGGVQQVSSTTSWFVTLPDSLSMYAESQEQYPELKETTSMNLIKEHRFHLNLVSKTEL